MRYREVLERFVRKFDLGEPLKYKARMEYPHILECVFEGHHCEIDTALNRAYVGILYEDTGNWGMQAGTDVSNEILFKAQQYLHELRRLNDLRGS